jgi:hypothetical protein
LIGIALGWQASVTIFALAMIPTSLLFAFRAGNRCLLRSTATSVLSTVAFLHQPVWKWLAAIW